MANWAEIDENNIVIRITVGDDNDPNGDDGLKWLIENLGGKWVKTSYTATFGKKYAAIGDTYIPQSGNFKPAQPFQSWIWNANAWSWKAPNPMPIDGNSYSWDEAGLAWIEASN